MVGFGEFWVFCGRNLALWRQASSNRVYLHDEWETGYSYGCSYAKPFLGSVMFAMTWRHCDLEVLSLFCHLHWMAHGQHPNFNSLAHGRFQFNIRKVTFKLTLVNGDWGISYEIALRWMPQDLTDDKSTMLTQICVPIWRHWATMS